MIYYSNIPLKAARASLILVSLQHIERLQVYSMTLL